MGGIGCKVDNYTPKIMSVENQSTIPTWQKVINSPMLADSESLEVFGEEVLRAIGAEEVLQRLRTEFLGETASFDYSVKKIKRTRHEKHGDPDVRVANIVSLSWDQRLPVIGGVERQSASIGILDGEHLGYYVGEGDPHEDNYAEKIWRSLRIAGIYTSRFETRFMEGISQLRPFIANQAISLPSPGLSERHKTLYETMAEELTVFYDFDGFSEETSTDYLEG